RKAALNLNVFFGLFFEVVRNDKINHFIRLNTMQALMLTIILFVLQLVIGLLGPLSFITTTLNTSVFLAVLTVFIFAVVQSFRGLYAELPSISEAVYMQVP
ncbi:MAG: Tic20 family protein, partial [Cyanobacteria bacterium P01_F01_bin.42]